MILARLGTLVRVGVVREPDKSQPSWQRKVLGTLWEPFLGGSQNLLQERSQKVFLESFFNLPRTFSWNLLREGSANIPKRFSHKGTAYWNYGILHANAIENNLYH